MTLILTALCKDGACVCSDKRNVNPEGRTDDCQYKIHSFDNVPIIIFNHGVNKFNNKKWKEYCSEYEQSGRWNNFSLYEIASDFKDFIEEDVRRELEVNFNRGLRGYTTAAFNFCGTTNRNVNYKIYELFWSYGSSGLRLERPTLGKFVLSGEGKKYLEREGYPLN